MPKFIWTVKVEIEAEDDITSYGKLIDKECSDLPWEVEEIEE